MHMVMRSSKGVTRSLGSKARLGWSSKRVSSSSNRTPPRGPVRPNKVTINSFGEGGRERERERERESESE
jgi:hypothetical protein